MLEDVGLAVCGQVGAREGERRVQVQAVPPAFVSQLLRRRWAFVLEGGARGPWWSSCGPSGPGCPPASASRSPRPPLSAYRELDLQVPDLDATAQTWVDRTPPLDGVLEPAGGTRPARLGGHRDGERRTPRRDRPPPARWRGPPRGRSRSPTRAVCRRSWRPPARPVSRSRTRRWPPWPPRWGTCAARSVSSTPWWTARAWPSPRTPGPWSCT